MISIHDTTWRCELWFCLCQLKCYKEKKDYNLFLSEAPYDEIAYHIRKSRGLPQPWQSEDKFGRKHPKDDRVEEPRPEPEAFDMDKDVRAETSFLGYVSQMKLDERVPNCSN